MDLKNQSAEMKTEVQTFLIEETVELIHDNDKLERWNKLVDELDLSGQTTIVKKEKSPIPFLHMKKSLVNVFETLCPMKREIGDYNLTPIPVEILELAALAKREDYFDGIQIWYDDENPDPACIGYKFSNWYVKDEKDQVVKSELSKQQAQAHAEGNPALKIGNYSWYRENYLIGRWADMKHSFETLKEMAIARFSKNEIATQNERILEAQRKIEDIQNTVHKMFN